MALCALQGGVLAFQWIGRGGVLLESISGRLEALNIVARCALPTIRTFGELAAVRIRPVAVHALRECQRLLEVASCVALRALHFSMLPQERVLGLRVIEALIDRGRRDPLPTTRVVAGLASLREAAFMRIAVAIGALAEGQSHEARLVVRSWRMTFLTGHLGVQSSQWIARLGVVKLADVFPVRAVVALLAVGPKASVVLVLVTADATGGYPQESLVQIVEPDERTHRW